jgi:predicted nuclease with TOPRIM domain
MLISKWLKDKIEELKRKRALARQIDPQAFRELTTELRELAEMASKLWLDEPQFQERIRRIKTEMAQLEELTAKPEFKRLSPRKRMELRESLHHSRDQLLESMHQAPSPTSRLQ